MSASRQGMTYAEINQIVAQRIIRQEIAVEKNTNNKRKFEKQPKDNRVPRKPPCKKLAVTRAYTIRAHVANLKATITCYECGRLGHFRNECQKLRNQNQVNQIWKEKARENSSVVKDNTNA
ncbi:reverse transcriptase domain-containing protein [Tanacetum coccineum]